MKLYVAAVVVVLLAIASVSFALGSAFNTYDEIAKQGVECSVSASELSRRMTRICLLNPGICE